MLFYIQKLHRFLRIIFLRIAKNGPKSFFHNRVTSAKFMPALQRKFSYLFLYPCEIIFLNGNYRICTPRKSHTQIFRGWKKMFIIRAQIKVVFRFALNV
jgi:hypothetical protein